MVGNVFSPWYARSRAAASAVGAKADPLEHCTMNVALYGPCLLYTSDAADE